jgi:raffinose/stachyose/melibiose transport system permease protein
MFLNDHKRLVFMEKVITKSTYRKRSKYIFAILFSAPAAIIYILFLIVPLIGVIAISLTAWNGASPMQFIGITNFKTLFASGSEMYKVLYNTTILLVLHLLIQIPMALIVSYLLYRTTQGFRFFRGVYFLPTVIAATCIALMFSIMLNGDIGPVNGALNKLGLHFLTRNWLADPTWALISVSLITVWQYIGYYISLMLAGMQTVPEEVIESATIDGASSIRIFFQIMLPLIQGILKICLLFSITGCLKQFDQTFIMTWGGPGNSSTFLAIFMWKTAFLKGDLGMATSIALVMIVLALLFYKALNIFIKED